MTLKVIHNGPVQCQADQLVTTKLKTQTHERTCGKLNKMVKRKQHAFNYVGRNLEDNHL